MVTEGITVLGEETDYIKTFAAEDMLAFDQVLLLLLIESHLK